MDEKRKRRLEALSKLARGEKRDVEEEGYSPVIVSKDTGYFKELEKKRKARAKAAIARQESGEDFEEQVKDKIKYDKMIRSMKGKK